MMITQPVIEKVALPMHGLFCSDELFPVLDSRLDSRVTRERENCMQVVRHEQAQPAMPDESLVVEFHGSEDRIASGWTAQLVFSTRHTIDCDKEPTALGHPLWNSVKQLLPNWQIHARSVAIPSYRT